MPVISSISTLPHLGPVRIHVLPDVAEATAEFARVLRPGGLRDVAEWDVGVELVTDSPAQ